MALSIPFVIVLVLVFTNIIAYTYIVYRLIGLCVSPLC